MNDIRYVCLSDLHLGAETSLLTKVSEGSITGTGIDPTEASSVLVGLAKILLGLIEQNKNTKVILVLNGDILEMALAKDEDAAMVFHRFLDQVMPPGKEQLFEKIIYIPGNHDHHLWEFARETLYTRYFESKTSNDQLDAPKHATPIFDNPVPSSFLTALIQEHANLKNLPVDMVYPNFGLASSGPDRKIILFHHGHFIESAYEFMTKLKNWAFPGSSIPDAPRGMELENFAWIDFFWSALGRSGQAGAAVDRVYEKLQDEGEVKKILENIITGIGGEISNPLEEATKGILIDWVAAVIAKIVCGLTKNIPDSV